MGCGGFRRGGISALELQRLIESSAALTRDALGLGEEDSPTFAGVTLVNGSNSAVLEMQPGGAVLLTNVGGTGRAFNVVTTGGGEFTSEFNGGVWSFDIFGTNELEVTQGAVSVTNELTAGLLERTPILPLVVEQSLAGNSISLLDAETGCIARFVNDGTGGTIELPASPADGWQCRLILSGSYAGDPFNIITNSVAVYCPWYAAIDGWLDGLQADGPSVIDFHWDNTNTRWIVTFLVGNVNIIP